MPLFDSSRKRVRFGDFEVDLDSCELHRRGVRLKVQVQPFQVLQALLERPGQVLTREELQKKIWPGHRFGDFDQGLNNAVKRLREVLGDDAEKPVFIETIPKRGYRFIGSIQDGGNDAFSARENEAPADEFAEHRTKPRSNVEAQIVPSQVEESSEPGKPIAPSGEFYRGVAAGFLLCIFVLAIFLLHSYSRQFGASLVQLGLRLEGRPTLAMTPATESLPPSVSRTNPPQQVRSAIREQIPVSAPIPFSPLGKPYLRPIEGGSEPSSVGLASVASDGENSPTSRLSALPIFPLGDLNLTSVIRSIDVAQPEVVSDDTGDTRGYLPPNVNSTAGKYLDVVKYRDVLRANQVMDELAKIGFYGTIVHNRTLWINSYHILGGPYPNEEELEAARPGLEARGFAPRVLPSRSTHIRLPAMTLYGTDLTIRDCIVTWELNSPEATVKFIKGRKVVATVRGKWKRREFVTSPSDAVAVVSLDLGRGPETLLEFQWGYADKVLVFDGSPFKFYFSPS